MNKELYNAYLKILEEELLPAMGCTEPIAIAYGGACIRELLGKIPEFVTIQVSGNLVKNAKSVTVPNTDGMRGIEAALAAGIVAGNANRQLEVIAEIGSSEIPKIKDYLERGVITVELLDTPLAFDYVISAKSGNESAKLRVANAHTNIVYKERCGEVLLDTRVDDESVTGLSDHTVLTVKDIIEFADTVDIADVYALINNQIEYNVAICDEGLKNSWGASIGKTILNYGATDSINRAKARAAAGSDARMNGCAMPVVILSGSGNQGITASVPLVSYAEDIFADEESLIRAVVVSDLIAIHLKTYIGRLSAFCGAVCAGVGAGAGVCYLDGGRYEEIAHTVVNALAISSGIICDGAKSSCAAKIALSVEAGFMGWNMYKGGNQFYRGDGIVSAGVELTIRNVGTLGHEGMKHTDRKILEIMTADSSSCM